MTGKANTFNKDFLKKCYELGQRIFDSIDTTDSNKKLANNFKELMAVLYYKMLSEDEWLDLLKEDVMIDIVEQFKDEGRKEVLEEANLMVTEARKKAEEAEEIIIVLAEINEEPERRSKILSLHGFTDEEFKASVAAIKSKVPPK
jgi:site-specific recombinase